MATQVEQLADDTVRLTVDVPAHDVHHAVEHAANDLAQSVRIPGFRKGKVPMPLLMQRIGKERLYTEAVESHIGGWFWNAATRARLNPVAQPEFEYDLPDGSRRTATVAVKELKERVLPPLDDDLAKAASEFDSLADLRSDIETRLRAQIDDELEGLFRAAAVDELVRATDFTPAGPLV